MVWKDECTQLQLTHITNTLVQFVEKIPEHCFAITLTNHSVQTQIHFTNARPRFRPDWASSGACSVHNAYVCVQNYIYRYSMACDVKCTYATQTLHVCYVQFSGKVGDGVNFESLTVSTIAHKHKTQYE